ncbi:DUF3027 domain-containing protein [Trueperella bernardiae]|uniref:DUF3027 domain-containing protein n=1 Tax=Trueperella bernardiae TaxID=59561 RepID=A0AAW6ZFF7_9ACTO|nr:DUF3027 domain-containing protein [Trueperella bernardiae]MDK8602619.1 DUF3027 domain-containing protein [Trueperella bernardiae]
MSHRINPTHNVTREKTLARAVDQAREALLDVTHASNVGEHAGVVQEGERVVTHAFTCQLPGYKGWFWTVTLSRVPRARRGTVDEVSLLPGPDALLAPEWVPWADRLRPSDVSGTDRLPYNPDDSNLTSNDPLLDESFEAAGVDGDELAEFELGLGRARVLSDQGRQEAFKRWYDGDGGPHNQATRTAKATCSTCGYLLHMGGSARQLFGVCANEWSAYDGRVVSLDHGCGAHSETDTPKPDKMWDPTDPVLDDHDLDITANE